MFYSYLMSLSCPRGPCFPYLVFEGFCANVKCFHEDIYANGCKKYKESRYLCEMSLVYKAISVFLEECSANLPWPLCQSHYQYSMYLTIKTQSHSSLFNLTFPFSIPLSPFPSHFLCINPTLCAPIPLFQVHIHYPTTTLLVYTPTWASGKYQFCHV